MHTYFHNIGLCFLTLHSQIGEVKFTDGFFIFDIYITT